MFKECFDRLFVDTIKKENMKEKKNARNKKETNLVTIN